MEGALIPYEGWAGSGFFFQFPAYRHALPDKPDILSLSCRISDIRPDSPARTAGYQAQPCSIFNSKWRLFSQSVDQFNA